jgi:hypothetical protein
VLSAVGGVKGLLVGGEGVIGDGPADLGQPGPLGPR